MRLETNTQKTKYLPIVADNYCVSLNDEEWREYSCVGIIVDVLKSKLCNKKWSDASIESGGVTTLVKRKIIILMMCWLKVVYHLKQGHDALRRKKEVKRCENGFALEISNNF